jgi:hypothetical protein
MRTSHPNIFVLAGAATCTKKEQLFDLCMRTRTNRHGGSLILIRAHTLISLIIAYEALQGSRLSQALNQCNM